MTFYFYVKQNGLVVAKGSASTKEEAEREARHYAILYRFDGPVEVTYRKVGKA